MSVSISPRISLGGADGAFSLSGLPAPDSRPLFPPFSDSSAPFSSGLSSLVDLLSSSSFCEVCRLASAVDFLLLSPDLSASSPDFAEDFEVVRLQGLSYDRRPRV